MRILLFFILSLLPLFSLAQDRDDQWRKIENLLHRKNYQEAAPYILDIKSRAKETNNSPEWIRAVLAEQSVVTANMTEAQAFYRKQEHFIEYILSSPPLERTILQILYAQFLYDYSNIHRVDKKDAYLSWDHDKRISHIDSIMQQVFDDKELLLAEQNPLSKWKIFIGDNSFHTNVVPTLYHVVVYTYIRFQRWMGSSNTDDIIHELQQINKDYHFEDAYTYLSAYPYLQNDYQIIKNIEPLESIVSQSKSPTNAYILLMIAQAYYNDQQHTKALNTIDRALEYKSTWDKELNQLIKKINHVELSMSLNQVSPANLYTPLKITALNTEKAYIRVYNTTQMLDKHQVYEVKHNRDQMQVQLDAPIVYQDEIQLKSFDDYKSHSTIYKIDPLPYGHYTVMIANNADFKDDGEGLEVQHTELLITDILFSGIKERTEDNRLIHHALLINRKTGLPHRDKQIALYDLVQQEWKQMRTMTTNEHGRFDYVTEYPDRQTGFQHLYLYIPDEKQFIQLDKQYISERSYQANNQIETCIGVVLTDQAIYRPGQEIFFKGILHENKYNGNAVPDETVTIFLKDANRQKTDSLVLTTNQLGSVSGSFRLPARTLNGRFALEMFHRGQMAKSVQVTVEEYKKPTFKVSFDANESTYTKKDTAIFTGSVESLSGAKLSDINVKYSISYTRYTPYQRITHKDTITQTDANGKFTLSIPLTDTAFATLSNLYFQIAAEAINANGEIQQTNMWHYYNDKPLRIHVLNTGKTIEEKWNEMVIQTTNSNGYPLAAKGQIKIYKYDAPTIVQGEQKTFDFQASYLLLDTTQYEKWFPWYFDKTILNPTKKLVGSYDFDSNGMDTVALDAKRYRAGSYYIEVMGIRGNDTTHYNTQLEITTNEGKTSDKDILVARFDREDYAVGDKATLHIQSDFKQANGIYLWRFNGSNKSSARYIPLKKGKTAYTFRVTEEDHIRMTAFQIVIVQENKLQTEQIHLRIKPVDRDIIIKAATFREKIMPGQQEKWTFTLSHQNKAIASEVLASMYDTALDQFVPHGFPSAFTHHWYRYYPPQEISYNLYKNQHSQTPYRRFGSYGFTNYYLPTIGYTRYAIDFPVGDFAARRVESVLSGSTVTIRGEVIGSTKGVPDHNSVSSNIIIGGLNNNLPQQALVIIDGQVKTMDDLQALSPESILQIQVLKDTQAVAVYGSRAAHGVIAVTTKEGHKLEQLKRAQTRTNLQETAFFYPNLLTDKDGNITFEFTSPEALTKWKLMLFAHTKDLKAGAASFFTQTQKQLMVRPNMPRFVREGDEIIIKAQIQNLSQTQQNGTAQLEIIDPETNEPITSAFITDKGLRDFSTEAGLNTTVSWALHIPKNYSMVHVRIVGATEEFSDGELHPLAILPDRVLVTESKKIILRPQQMLTQQISASDKDHVQATIQIQGNPILEVLSALDYLKNYPYECNEQTASKWYGLKMLQYIQKHYPAISQFINSLDPKDTRSKLEENSTLSKLLKEEMPWIRQLQNDKEKVKSLVRLFRSDMALDIRELEQKLQKTQMENGGFSWFDGGKSNTEISIRLLEIFGKVAQLDRSLLSGEMLSISQNLVHFLDQDPVIYETNASPILVTNYLYARSFWNDSYVLPTEKTEQLREKNAQLLRRNHTAPGLSAKAWLVNARYDYRIASIDFKNRIANEVIYDKERGMYWESNAKQHNSMSLQSYLVEAYQELDSTRLDQLTQWIYYSKSQNHWATTWNTVDAVYALLLTNKPSDFSPDNTVSLSINGKQAVVNDKVLGQVSTTIPKQALNQDQVITLENRNNRTVYGGIYHQYFVPLEEIQSVKNELSVKKKMFVEKNGEWIESTTFKTGEKIKIQLIVVNNEDLNYVHLKDSRAAGFEPIYQPSGYTWWQGYYFTIRDASTNYFFDYLPKGRHVYEYEVKTNNNGVFNSGIAQIECMYNPIIRAVSSSNKITIEEN